MNIFNQFRSPLFWVPVLLVACGLALSLYADAQTRPGHIGESFAYNAGFMLILTLLIAVVCSIILMFRSSWLAGLILLVPALYFAYRLFI